MSFTARDIAQKLFAHAHLLEAEKARFAALHSVLGRDEDLAAASLLGEEVTATRAMAHALHERNGTLFETPAPAAGAHE